jgi:cell division protein ZapA (FtsZ GTPase activity inhibitor)
MTEPFQIEILGQKFNLKGNYEKDYVKKVEKFFNDKIQEVQKQTTSISTHNLLVLVALNIIDAYFKQENELEQLVEFIEGTSENLINLLDATI